MGGGREIGANPKPKPVSGVERKGVATPFLPSSLPPPPNSALLHFFICTLNYCYFLDCVFSIFVIYVLNFRINFQFFDFSDVFCFLFPKIFCIHIYIYIFTCTYMHVYCSFFAVFYFTFFDFSFCLFFSFSKKLFQVWERLLHPPPQNPN